MLFGSTFGQSSSDKTHSKNFSVKGSNCFLLQFCLYNTAESLSKILWNEQGVSVSMKKGGVIQERPIGDHGCSEAAEDNKKRSSICCHEKR